MKNPKKSYQDLVVKYIGNEVENTANVINLIKKLTVLKNETKKAALEDVLLSTNDSVEYMTKSAGKVGDPVHATFVKANKYKPFYETKIYRIEEKIKRLNDIKNIFDSIEFAEKMLFESDLEFLVVACTEKVAIVTARYKISNNKFYQIKKNLLQQVYDQLIVLHGEKFLEETCRWYNNGSYHETIS